MSAFQMLTCLVCVAAFAGRAAAEQTREVQIETDPPNATVYIGDTDSGPKCKQTPCKINAPLGQPTIIIRLEKYEPLVENIDVPRGKRPLTVHFKLRSAIGTIIVSQPKGASVQIDGEDQGTVGSTPLRADVSAEPHMIVVMFKGKTLFDEAVEVPTGDEVDIGPDTTGWKSSGVAVSTNTGGGDGDGEGDGGGGGGDGGGGGGGGDGDGDTGITGTAEPARREPFLNIALAFDVGFRSFTYDMPQGENLKPESEAGQVILGPAVEIFPMRALHKKALKGLSLFARGEFGVHGQQLTGGKIMGTVTTFWASYEGSLRYRFRVTDGFGVEASGGYVRDQMQFNASNGNDIALVPDVTYDALRVGVKLVLVSGKIEAYLGGEERVVLSGGTLASRFDSANATGVRGSLGATYSMGPIFARAEGAVMRYSWTFTYDGVNDVEQADGATDSVKLISFLAGYRY